MKLPSNIRFVDQNLKNIFLKLENGKKEEKILFKQLIKAFEEIENNAFCGIQIPKKQIPKKYLRKYDVHNLWKYNLPKAWRLLHSVENQDILIVSIVISWLSHKEYEKRFKY